MHLTVYGDFFLIVNLTFHLINVVMSLVISNLILICKMQVALDYIGKRGATVGVTKEKRIKFVLKLLHSILLFSSFASKLYL